MSWNEEQAKAIRLLASMLAEVAVQCPGITDERAESMTAELLQVYRVFRSEDQDGHSDFAQQTE